MNLNRTSRITKILVAGTVASLAALTLASCGSDTKSEGPTEITFSYLWAGAEAEAIEKIIANYNGSQEEVVVKGISSPDFQKQLTSMSASQGTFDISDHFGNSVGSWATKGILKPLDDYIKSEDINVDDFIPAAMEQMTHDGKVYSLPIAVHSFQLMYNKDLLDEAGVAVPETMDDLAAAIDKLTVVDGSGAISRLGLGNPSLDTSLTTLGYNFGGNWDGGGEPTPTDPKLIESLQWYQDALPNKFGADKISTFISGLGEYMSAQDPFYTGEYAMIIDGEWRAANAAAVAPELNWGVTSIPYVSADLKDVTQLTASTLFIPANAKNPDEAANFLAYLVSEEGMTDFAFALGNVPARTSLLDSSKFDEIDQFSAWANALKSPNVFALSSAPHAAEYAADLGVAFDEISRGVTAPEKAMQGVLDRAKNYSK